MIYYSAKEAILAVDDFLTAKQLQELLQVDRITIYRMLKDGRLKGFKVGNQWRFSRQEIERRLLGQHAGLHGREALSPAETRASVPSPAELPLSCMKLVQDILAEAMGVAALTVSPAGQPLTPISHANPLCALILSSAEGRRLCERSWELLARQASPDCAGECHLGLRYLGHAVETQGKQAGVVLVGQFVEDEEHLEHIARRLPGLAQASGLNETQLRERMEALPLLPETEVRGLARLVRKVALTFMEFCDQRAQLVGRLQRIADLASLAGPS